MDLTTLGRYHQKKTPHYLSSHIMHTLSNVILSCNDCPFNGQDNVYCRNCTIPAARAAKLAHRLARHRRRASARRRRWLRKQSVVYRVGFGYGWGI